LRTVALLVLLGVILVTPAHAHLFEIATSTAAPSADARPDEVDQAVRAAVAAVVRDTAGFTPTLIVLTRALVVGDRLYLRLLVADQEGERAFLDPPGESDLFPDRSPESRL